MPFQIIICKYFALLHGLPFHSLDIALLCKKLLILVDRAVFFVQI